MEKNSENVAFRSFFKRKNGEMQPKQIGVVKPCSITDFLELVAPVLLKLTTKGFLRAKQTLEIELFSLLF